MNRKLLVLGAGATLLMISNLSFAAGSLAATRTFYEIELTPGCTVASLSATGQDFGSHPVNASDLKGVNGGSVTVTCPSGVKYIWGIDAGQNYATGKAGERDMSDGSEHYVEYRLYDANLTPVGDKGVKVLDPTYTDTTTQNAIPATGTGTPQIHSMTADVYTSVQGVAGKYSDIVNAVVAW